MVISTEHIKNFASEKEQALKHLEQLSLKTVGAIPWLRELDYFQKAWFVRRMRGPARSWKRWNEE